MEYILPDSVVDLVVGAAEHLDQPVALATSIQATDPRLCQVIEALGGRAVAETIGVSLLHGVKTAKEIREDMMRLPPLESVDQEASDLIERNADPSPAGEETRSDRKPEAEEVGAAAQLCEICNERPCAGPRSHICDNPECKKQRAARYVRDAYHRKHTAGDPEPETPAEEADLVEADDAPAPEEAPEGSSPLAVSGEVWSVSTPWLVTTGSHAEAILTTEELARMIDRDELEDGTRLTHIVKGEHQLLPASSGYRVRLVPAEDPV